MGGMTEPGVEHHLLVQAPVPAVDEDGLVVVVIGTASFAVATVACVMLRGWLTSNGHQDWTAISLSGFVLGLVGLAYCGYRRRRRNAGPHALEG